MRQVVLFAGVVALLGVFGCDDKKADVPAATPEAKPSVAATVAPAVTTAAPSAEPPKAEPTAAPSASAAADVPAAATASAAPSAGPAPTGTAGAAAAGPKTFECGAKGQKLCPMQGWMKGVIGQSTSRGDTEKMAKDLAYIAAKPPPGMGQWAAIAQDGAAKAKAGDVDGAKVSCKKCHDLYKDKYKTSMRDMPW